MNTTIRNHTATDLDVKIIPNMTTKQRPALPGVQTSFYYIL